MAGCFGFRSTAQVFVYVVAVFCGISMLMPINAIFSAPSYILFFYQYVEKNPNATPTLTNFWANVLNYYNFISLITSLIAEPLTLSKLFSRINVQLRMLAGLIILVVEIALFLIVPAVGSNEVGAVVTICVGGCISGIGKSIFEATVYGMFGAFPSRYLAAVMGGAGVSGALTSTLQMIVRGALQNGYEDVRTQSKIYYGLSVGVQSTTFICLILMRWNSFAKQHVACFNKDGIAPAQANNELDYLPSEPGLAAREMGGAEDGFAGPVEGAPALDAAGTAVGAGRGVGHVTTAAEKEAHLGAEDEVREVPELTREAQTQLESHALAQVNKVAVFKAIWPLFTASAFDFGLTLMLFPTIVISVDPNDYWYGTAVVFVFNVFDVVGRFSPTWARLRPKTYRQRWIVLVASFARVIFLPLLLLASYHKIPSHAFGYVMMVLFGYSNGYIGAVSMVLAPLSPQLRSDAQRFVSGTMMGISILLGGTIGTALGIMIQSVRKD